MQSKGHGLDFGDITVAAVILRACAFQIHHRPVPLGKFIMRIDIQIDSNISNCTLFIPDSILHPIDRSGGFTQYSIVVIKKS